MPNFYAIPKQLFFDRKRVADAVDRAKRAALSKIGAFVRTREKSLTGKVGSKANPTAPAGKPPRRHAGQLHDLIYFAYDDAGSGVDIGPVRFRQGEAPALLEFGGTVTRRRYQRKTHAHTGPAYQAHYQGNPFAAPALAAELQAGTIPSVWAGSVKSN